MKTVTIAIALLFLALSSLSFFTSFTSFTSGASGLAFADDFKGQFFEPNSDQKKPVYRLDRTEKLVGNQRLAKGYFYSASNELAIDEDTVWEDGQLKSYGFKRLLEKEAGSVEVRGKKIHFSYTKDGKQNEADEDLTPNFVVAATLLDYIGKNWDTVIKGETLDMRYGVLDRRETVGFKLFKISEGKVDARETLVLKMKPTSFIIAAIVDPVILTIDKGTKHLLKLNGRLLPKLFKDGHWVDFDGEGIYTYASDKSP